MKTQLSEDNEGTYRLKDNPSKTRFLIGTEVASIKKHKDKTRRVRRLLFAPNLEVAEKFNKTLENSNVQVFHGKDVVEKFLFSRSIIHS